MDDVRNPDDVGGGSTPNPTDSGASPQETPSSAGTETPTPPPLDLRGLQAQLEQERQRAERLTQQYNGAQQEATRWRTEFERRQQEADERQKEFQQGLLRLAGGEPEVKEYTDLQSALDAWYQGKDPTAPSRYDSWLREHLTTKTKAEAWAEMQERLTPMARIQQVYERYPELKTPSSKEYQAAHDQYQALAQDPYYQSLFPQDPQFTVTAVNPATGERQPVDLRLMELAMSHLQRANGVAQGRQQEAERRNAPTVEGGPGGGSPGEPDTPLMTADEKTFIRQNLATFSQMGWGKTEDQIVQHRWKNTISAEEKARRRRMAASGNWP